MTTADMSAAGTPATVGIDSVSLPLAPTGAILPVPVPTRVSRMRSGEPRVVRPHDNLVSSVCTAKLVVHGVQASGAVGVRDAGGVAHFGGRVIAEAHLRGRQRPVGRPGWGMTKRPGGRQTPSARGAGSGRGGVPPQAHGTAVVVPDAGVGHAGVVGPGSPNWSVGNAPGAFESAESMAGEPASSGNQEDVTLASGGGGDGSYVFVPRSGLATMSCAPWSEAVWKAARLV